MRMVHRRKLKRGAGVNGDHPLLHMKQVKEKLKNG